MEPGGDPLFLREEALRDGAELVWRAGRALTESADAALAEVGLGRAHHRALFLIARNPEISVGMLAADLGVAKQSLARVLADLKDRDFVVSQRDPADGRSRLLRVTPAGAEVERRIGAVQRAALARAYRRAGPAAVEGHRAVLAALTTR